MRWIMLLPLVLLLRKMLLILMLLLLVSLMMLVRLMLLHHEDNRLLVLSCHPVTGKDSAWQVGYDLLIYSTFLSHPAGRSFVLVCRDRRG